MIFKHNSSRQPLLVASTLDPSRVGTIRVADLNNDAGDCGHCLGLRGVPHCFCSKTTYPETPRANKAACEQMRCTPHLKDGRDFAVGMFARSYVIHCVGSLMRQHCAPYRGHANSTETWACPLPGLEPPHRYLPWANGYRGESGDYRHGTEPI